MTSLASEIGARGEAAAVEWLRRHGYLIEELNWRAGRYEIDIVASRWDEIHFVEVKTRMVGGWQSPEQAMTRHKCESLIKAARPYLAMKRCQLEPLFDLIAVDVQPSGEMEIRMIENVIESRW